METVQLMGLCFLELLEKLSNQVEQEFRLECLALSLTRVWVWGHT